jgi:cytoskeletal protein CcmA (bactofilin family)
MWKRDQSAEPPPAQPKVSEPPPPPERGAPVEPLVMNLGDSVVIKGELSGSEDLTLYGQMQGSVKLPEHTLTIGPHAEIKADIAAKAVVIAGAVVGTVTASQKVDIQATGSVTGDILSPRLTIADGGYFLGKIDMSRPEGQPRPEKGAR